MLGSKSKRYTKVDKLINKLQYILFLCKGYFTIPRTEPVRPIDPGAWVAHTQALTSHDSICPDISEPIKERLDRNNLEEIVKAMTKQDSGLEIRDRMWLKITIPNAFIGKNIRI